jgi:lysophospholipid acyltransferase (LPLAT)-like uncharacterized protein
VASSFARSIGHWFFWIPGGSGIEVVAKSIRTKSQRKLTRGRRLAYWLAVRLARLIIELLWRTCRVRFDGDARLHALIAEHGSVVPVCWHQHLLLSARYLVSKPGGLKPGFMISPSVDGEAPTWLAQSYGAHVVRGSGSYTGIRALRGVHQAIVKEGISPGVTPDGPRGPRFKFKPGAIFAAQISGKPVVPIAFAAKPAFVLDTWDKFVLPVPFGRVTIAIGEPYFPPDRMTDAEMQVAQREMERRMLDTYHQAHAALA